MRILALFLILCTRAAAQGLYQDYGQNSTQSHQESYSLRQDQVEILYQAEGEKLAALALNKVRDIIPEFENRLNYNLSNGIRILVFNNFDDYIKSNLNISNPQYFAGGYSTLNENVASVYFDGSRINFNKQLRKAVARVMINEFIFGGNIRERIQTAALLSLPAWYYKGLVAYLAESWNIDNDNFLKDFFQNKKHRYFNSLKEEDEILAGQSIWRYLEEKNGAGAVSNIVFLTKVGRSVENAVMYYTGLSIGSLMKDWQEFYLEKYKTDELIFKFPKGQENAPAKLGRKRHTQFKLSNDGRKIAIVTNTSGRYQIVLYDIKSRKVKLLLRGGHQLLNRDIDYNYPLIAWNPLDNALGVVLYKGGKSILERYNTDGHLLSKHNLNDVPFVKGFAYAPDGKKIVCSVIRNGQSDLLIYDTDLQSGRYISNDAFDNLSPRFSKDGKRVLYISNQFEDSRQESDYYAIFSMDISSGRSVYLTGMQAHKVNSIEPSELDSGKLSYLCDQNGILNNYIYEPAGNNNYQLTNYKRCIIHNDIAASAPVVADLLYFNNRYRIYVGIIAEDFRSEAINNAALTAYRKLLNAETDSNLHRPALQTPPGINKDSHKTADTANAARAKRIFISGYTEKDKTDAAETGGKDKKDPYYSSARPHFGIDYFIQQFDNSILNSPLFPAGVNEKVFNYPLLSPHFQTCISDVQKNHSITAGIRIPLRTRASDYYFRYMNRKGRWDKELDVFRRGRVFDYTFSPMRMVNTQVKYTWHYPFDERSRITLSLFVRDDKIIRLATDSIELQTPVRQNLYFGNGFSYVYDNVRSNGLNLFQGLRIKVYSENFHRSGPYEFISNNGLDGRWYKKLHRQIYMALRISAGVSLGTQTTAYYMGGVENWLVNVDTNRNFNYNIPTLNGPDYAFQSIVSPVRGFLRNSRSGNKFALFNAELRIPVFEYLLQKPISSDFFRSIMVCGFADIGTAWRGSSPYSIDNPFNTRIIQMPQYTITVVSQRDPFLYAFGFGVRAKILGHYLKWDCGWGIIESKLQPALSTFSIGLDF